MDVWMGHFTSLANRQHTIRHKDQVLDVIGDFPRSDGSGMLRLGTRIQDPGTGVFDVLTFLTRQP